MTREALTIEYLVTTTTHVPEGTSAQAVADVCAREAARSHELTVQGHLLRRGIGRCSRANRAAGLLAADVGQLEMSSP